MKRLAALPPVTLLSLSDVLDAAKPNSINQCHPWTRQKRRARP